MHRSCHLNFYLLYVQGRSDTSIVIVIMYHKRSSFHSYKLADDGFCSFSLLHRLKKSFIDFRIFLQKTAKNNFALEFPTFHMF